MFQAFYYICFSASIWCKFKHQNFWRKSSVYQSFSLTWQFEFHGFRYINEAKQINRHSEFIRKEKLLFKDTGLDPKQVKVPLGTDDYTYKTPVTYYYFTVNGKEFFIADFMIDYDASLIRHYSNYDEVFN